MSQWKIALLSVLLGVIVGFVLNEVSQLIKKRLLTKQLKKALVDELESNLYQLDQKIDIANQMINAINQGKFLPGISVAFASSVYFHHFPSILTDFNSIQRDNIRHIYSSLIVLDEITSSLEKSYKEDIQTSVLADITTAYSHKVEDIIYSYNILKILITSYLKGNPVDIYYRNTASTKQVG